MQVLQFGHAERPCEDDVTHIVTREFLACGLDIEHTEVAKGSFGRPSGPFDRKLLHLLFVRPALPTLRTPRQAKLAPRCQRWWTSAVNDMAARITRSSSTE
eukprot:4135228-Pleurochrysis_carterae.AAC.1